MIDSWNVSGAGSPGACREARKRFNEAVVLGVHRTTTGVHANPPDSFQLREDDTLFALAYDQSKFKAVKVRSCCSACCVRTPAVLCKLQIFGDATLHYTQGAGVERRASTRSRAHRTGCGQSAAPTCVRTTWW